MQRELPDATAFYGPLFELKTAAIFAIRDS